MKEKFLANATSALLQYVVDYDAIGSFYVKWVVLSVLVKLPDSLKINISIKSGNMVVQNSHLSNQN